MNPISNAVMALFEAEQRQVLHITGTDKNGTSISITEANVMENGFHIDRYCWNGNKMEVGTAIAAEMDLTLDNRNGQFNGVVFEGTELFVEIGIADWSQSEPIVNWMPCGRFTSYEQPRSRDTIVIHALDRMAAFDVPVDQINFPATAFSLVGQIATRFGYSYNIIFNYLTNIFYNVSELPNIQTEITYRTVIQWLAGIMGGIAYIDYNGALCFAGYNAIPGSNAYTTTQSNRFSSDLHEADIAITGAVYTTTGGETIVSGTADYAVDLTGNYLAASGIAEILPNINTRLNGFTYRPFEATVINAPYLWPLDMIKFTDKDGTTHNCLVTNVNFGINGATRLEGKGETGQANKGISGSGMTTEQAFLLEKAKQAAVDDVDEMLSPEDIFNRLTDNGVIQGLFVKDGQIYVNASYIQSGTLVLGGLNNVNGTLVVKDASGNEIGSITKDGFVTSAIYGSDTVSTKMSSGALIMLNGNGEMGRIWAANISGSGGSALFINGAESTGSQRSGLSLWPNGDADLSAGDGAAELDLYKNGNVELKGANVILQSDGGANIYVTDNGDAEIRSNNAEASLIIKADGTITAYPAANWRSGLGITPGNIGAYSKAETDSLVAARMYPVYGNIIKSASTGTAVGYGRALVYIVGQTVIVEFEGKIITEGTITNVYDVGIQVANLRSINSAIPAFTVAERGIVHYYKSDGTLDTSMEGYAGTSALNVSGGHWACGRVYDTNGSIGAWADNKYAVGTIITGRLYGTR